MKNQTDENHIVLPVNRSRADARSNYDRLSRTYDALVASGERRYRNAGLAALDVKPGERILEIGSGTGLALAAVAEQGGQAGQAVGIDLSPGMTAIAKRRVTGLQSVHLSIGDAVHLPYAAAHFDGILICFTLELFEVEEIYQVMQECFRVLRHGGRLVAVSLSRAAPRSLMTRVYEWAHLRFPKLLDCRPIYLPETVAKAGFVLRASQQLPYWGLKVAVIQAERP